MTVSFLLRPLASAYRLGAALRAMAYERGWIAARTLKRPVVSVGNLTVGGTGKTPLVAYVAKTLLGRGLKPAILTRGYGRGGGPRLIAIDPGPSRAPDPRRVGDEPALLARQLPDVPIVVSSDRYRGGHVAEERFGVDVHILDDGFQRLSLARALDIVALDATQQLSNASLLPAGRQREPLSAMRRADVAVFTRTELGANCALRDLAGRINPAVELFNACTKPDGLTDIVSGKVYPLDAFQREPVYAFCGVGNPQAFFADVEAWGFRLAGQRSFSDHHVYSNRDHFALRRAATMTGAKALVTTEKDAMNLPSSVEWAVPVLAFRIKIELLEAGAFEETLLSFLRRPTPP